ncbi:FG-GAP-like repeat-containing protein [Streptomyces sp. enrichment culture]|uniref:FG-GAP-like repeat-containing protein n=1 Tax=Streptomyces sp. enrichment culture TaxID=1795815 RepID=UPI003F55B378
MGTATAITGTDISAFHRDLVTAADGSAVAVWNQFTQAGSAERKLYAAVRPAGHDTWGTPKLLTTTPTEAGSVRLHASADGSVTALWVEFPNETRPGSGPYNTRVVTSVLAADKSAWSAPVELVGTDKGWGDGGIDLAEGPDGTLTAVWTTHPDATSPWEVSAAVRAADGTWSAPVQLSTATADGARAALSPSVAVTSDGTTVVAYAQHLGESGQVLTVSRAAGSTEWTRPVAATGTYQYVYRPQIASAGDGTVTLSWLGRIDESVPEAINTAVRTADGTWSAAQTVTATDDLVETPEPLIGPDGDVTLVWVDRTTTTTFGTRTATREADTGAWSAVRTLSTSSVSESYDAAIGADGTVRALWPQSGGGKRVMTEAVRSDGKWTTAAHVPGSANVHVHGQVSVGADGTATAVWSGMATSTANWRLYGSRDAWPTLAVTGSNVPGTAPLKGTTPSSTAWTPIWSLSRPTSSWSLTITDRAGRTLRTLTGATADLTVRAAWNGRTTAGAYAPNGPLTWTLRAVQEGSASAVKLATGTVTVTGGAAVSRDFGGPSATPDGTGDLLTLSSTGVLSHQFGKASTGTFSGRVSGSGWATNIKAVPFGDLNGDRCNDVLVRYGNGALRLYKPACGKAVTPSMPYTTLATGGWTSYDVLTSPGDLTKDGRPDLIARNASTGTVYLYKGTSTGKLSARVKLHDNWKTYKKVIGAGDLNGDGIGDLLAQDTSNNLYRYYGTGSGTFGARAKLYSAWGSSYNAVVGVGDITGDGRADLVSRDTAGVLWRQAGTGTGSFGARVKIGTGWGGYKSLS